MKEYVWDEKVQSWGVLKGHIVTENLYNIITCFLAYKDSILSLYINDYNY